MHMRIQAFYVSGGGQSTIRQANKRFNSTGHDYEITLNRECEVPLANRAKSKLNL